MKTREHLTSMVWRLQSPNTNTKGKVEMEVATKGMEW